MRKWARLTSGEAGGRQLEEDVLEGIQMSQDHFEDKIGRAE